MTRFQLFRLVWLIFLSVALFFLALKSERVIIFMLAPLTLNYFFVGATSKVPGLMNFFSERSDHAYVKKNYPELWRALYPSGVLFTNIRTILLFSLGKRGKNDDRTLARIRHEWGIDLLQIAYSAALILFVLPLLLCRS
jgi:hypothetical protein